MEVMVPHYLLNFAIKIGLSIYVMEGFKIQENVMAVGLGNDPLEKIMVSAYVWTLGLGIFMMVNVMALVYVLILGLSIFKDVYVLAPVNVLTLGLRNHVIQYVATLGLRAVLCDLPPWAPRPSLGLAPRPSLGMTTNGWACDGDECGGGGSDDRYDDRYDEKYDDVGLLHGRALQPLCGEALLGFNGAARDTPGPGGAETLEEIYGCDWAALLPGHQGPAALPGRGHLPSCMRPVWPILNEDQVCEVGKNGWHMTPNAVQDVQLFLGFSHPHADPCSCVASANGSEKRAVPYNVKPQGVSELIGAKENSDSSPINSLTGDQISRHQSGPVGPKNDEFLQGSGAQLKIQVRSVNTSLEGSKSSAGAESQVAVAPVEGMSAYGGSCSGSFVAAMLFALPTLVTGQPGDGGRRDQDGDFWGIPVLLRAAGGLLPTAQVVAKSQKS